jgi:RNA-directed DNA polymerase
MQNVVKNAIEPEWEAKFEPNSYGFRPIRSTQDAIKQCWSRLNANCGDQWILDADIKGAFDNISHSFILNTIGNSLGRELIKQWLKTGYLEEGKFFATESGTPQGGVISPLLSNIALHGLEDILNSYVRETLYEHTVKIGKWKGIVNRQYLKSKIYGYSRYADDFIITAKSKEEIDAIIPVVSQFLKERGLNFNEEKTRIINIKDGFEFLGFKVQQLKGKCLVKPQKSKVLDKLREIKNWLKDNKTVSAEKVIKHLNPIIRGWGNYYSKVNSKGVFSYFSHRIWKMLWQWSLRRHLKKGKNWVKQKYFCRHKRRD